MKTIPRSLETLNLRTLATNPNYDGDEVEYTLAAVSSVMETSYSLDPYGSQAAAERDRRPLFLREKADVLAQLDPHRGEFIDRPDEFCAAIHHFDDFVLSGFPQKTLHRTMTDGWGRILDRAATFLDYNDDPRVPVRRGGGPTLGYQFTAAWPSSKGTSLFYVAYMLEMETGKQDFGQHIAPISKIKEGVVLEKRRSIEPVLVFRQTYPGLDQTGALPWQQGLTLVFAVGI